MTPKKFLIAAIKGAYFIYFLVINLLFGMSSGGSSTYPLFYSLLGFPLLFVVLFTRALEEENKRTRTRLFIGSFVVLLIGSIIIVWQPF